MKIETLQEKGKVLFSLILILGGVFLSYYFCPGIHMILALISLAITFVVWVLLIKKYRLLDKINNNIVHWVVAIMAAVIALQENYPWFAENKEEPIRKIAGLFGTYGDKVQKLLVIGVVACSALALAVLFLLFWQRLLDFLKGFLKQCDKIDKRYMVISGIVVAILILLVYNLTKIFYYTGIDYDVIYTTDTGYLSVWNVWGQVNHAENDMRQPLYAIGSLPFSSLAMLVGRILYLIPKTYIVLMAIIQGWLLIWVNAMLAKLLNIKGHVKIIYYLISSLAYSNLLFTLNLEQYVFAVFYLILFLYCILNQKDEAVNGSLYALSSGSLITSGVICLWKEKYSGWKDFIKTIVSRGLVFVGALAMFGRLWVLFDVNRFYFLLTFSDYRAEEVCTFREKILQYFNFIKSIYVKPEITIVDNMYYRLAQVDFVSIIGCILLLLVLVGLGLTIKNRLSQFSAFWILFSFGITAVVGWGASENGMILYTLYFGWAFTVLLFQLFQKICEKWKKVGISIGYIISALLLVVNGIGVLELIQFGITRYP